MRGRLVEQQQRRAGIDAGQRPRHRHPPQLSRTQFGWMPVDQMPRSHPFEEVRHTPPVILRNEGSPRRSGCHAITISQCLSFASHQGV